MCKKITNTVAKNWGKMAMLAIALFITSAANAQKPKLAVMDFMAGVGLYQNDVNGLSDMLINSLFNTGKFELIERGQLCQLIGETNLQKSSLSAGQLQQLAIKGVNFLLLGTVNLTGGEYNIDVRVVDVGTGQLYTTAGTTKLSGQTYRDMMPKLANELATKLPQTVKATVTVVSVPPPSTPAAPAVITLLGYLKVYPDDLGEFSSEPKNIISNINSQKMYGYDDWRLPTQEECELLKANSSNLKLKSDDYMKSNGRNVFHYDANRQQAINVRLVTTGKTAAAKEEEQRIAAAKAEEEKRKEQAERAEKQRTGEEKALQVGGVYINGVIWAKQNVGANSPTEYGNYYTFEQAQSACPSGWRLPTKEEIQSLLNSGSVWTTQSGVNGRLFGKVPNQMFFPAAGYRANSVGTLFGAGGGGNYWSSKQLDSDFAYRLHFNSGNAYWDYTNRRYGLSVRCVAE